MKLGVGGYGTLSVCLLTSNNNYFITNSADRLQRRLIFPVMKREDQKTTKAENV
jgi:hypothetical protein